MCRKFRLCIVLVFVVILYDKSFSQQVLASKNFYTQDALYYVLPTKQTDGDAIAISCRYKEKWISFLLNPDYTFSQDVVHPIQESGMYTDYLGYLNQGQNYTLFFSNNRHNKFITLNIDYAHYTSNESVLNLKVEDERYIASHNYTDKFCIVTVTDKSSIINTYEFNTSAAYKKTSYDFSGINFLGKFPQLHYNLLDDTPGERRMAVSKIPVDYPTSIATNQSRHKIFFSGDTIYVSLDKSKHTIILSLNIKDGTKSNLLFKQPPLVCTSGSFSSANSVIFKNHLYQVNACAKGLALRINDLKTGRAIKDMHMNKDNLQDFSYALFKQEIGKSSFSKAKEKDIAVDNFLKKIANAQVSVSVNTFTDSTIEVDIGKFEVRQSGMGLPVIPLGYMMFYYESYPSIIASKSILGKSGFFQLNIDENNKVLNRQRNVNEKIILLSNYRFSIKKAEQYLVGNIDVKKNLFELVKFNINDTK